MIDQMNKKILILQETLFTSPDANAKLIFRMCEQLCSQRYDVSVLGKAQNEQELTSEFKGIHLIHEPESRVRAARNLKERLGRFHWLRFLLLPRTIKYRYYNKQYTPFYLEVRRWLCKHVNEYDALIACCSPYYPLQLAAGVAKRIPVIYYKIDPIGSWPDKASWDAPLATIDNEIKWDSEAMRIIMPDVVYRDYMCLPTKVNGHKAVVAQFPNVRRLETVSGQQSGVSEQYSVISGQYAAIRNQLSAEQCNLLFVGKFYADIRHPQFLFDLMERLRDTNIVLHIVGPLNYKGFDKEYIDKYFTNKMPNIRYHGAVPPQEADDLLLYADVLVHVGNRVDTAMPSKILDYISSGKPILNLCKIRTCPTLPLMERYPLGMTVFEQTGSGQNSVISSQLVEDVKRFCVENKGKQVPYKEIEKLYPECTIEYVSKQFDETIQAAINEFNKTKI